MDGISELEKERVTKMKSTNTGFRITASLAAMAGMTALTNRLKGIGTSISRAPSLFQRKEHRRSFSGTRGRGSASIYRPHQGEQECARRKARGMGQYPEYTALRNRNIVSGKWLPGIGA